jgi:SagB-type dehydrogenase family enzyme
VHDVTDVPPGSYRYDPERHALLPVAEVDWGATRENLLLQHEHGEGAVVLFFVVPLAQWLHRFGDRGYRGAALQVGYLTDRLYLDAEALGLTYTASGGFAQARADQLLGLDGYHHTAVFAFVVGGPRRAQEGRDGD